MPTLVMRTDQDSDAQRMQYTSETARVDSPNDSSHSELVKRNRRKVYLDQNPGYFSTLELADPLLYDRCIRRFQTAPERESEGRAKGFSGTMMSDFCRNEAKQSSLAHPDPKAALSYPRGENGSILEEERNEAPATKEEGMERWKRLMSWRFLRGDDNDFDYATVDEEEGYDDHAEQQRDEEEQYYGAQSPSFEVEERRLAGQTGVQDF